MQTQSGGPACVKLKMSAPSPPPPSPPPPSPPPSPPPPSPPPPSFPPGLSYFVTLITGTYTEAKAACEARDASAILAVAVNQAEMDAQYAAMTASSHGNLGYWVGYTLPANSDPAHETNYDGENGQTMLENAFWVWATNGKAGTAQTWDRCVHAQLSNNGWYMETCTGPYAGVCQLGVRPPPPAPPPSPPAQLAAPPARPQERS